ncbi:MAG: exopolysaccharide biosynthesis protein [Methanosphaera sp.]|nr:exopolysaccharide biosynthesis protein [Methanosphaera sp.]
MDTDNRDSLKTSHKINNIYEELKKEDKVTIRYLVDIISDESSYLLILILIAPFLIPVSLPGSSTPFGILIILLAFSILFNRPLILPKKVAQFEISTESLDKLFSSLTRVLKYIEKVSHPRGNLTHNTYILKINSLIIILLASILFLPLPIPLTDFLPAVSILILAVSNLEHDTYLMIAGYVAVVGVLYYFYSFGSLIISIINRVLHILGITF